MNSDEVSVSNPHVLMAEMMNAANTHTHTHTQLDQAGGLGRLEGAATVSAVFYYLFLFICFFIF